MAHLTEILDGEIRLTVHDEVGWFPPTKMLNLDLAPAEIPIIEEVARRIPETRRMDGFQEAGISTTQQAGEGY